MTVLDGLVIVAEAAAIGGLAWFFFKPRQAAEATLEGGLQSVDITVKGGYSPSLIRVQSGIPVRLRFDRRENSDCTAKVVFPDFKVSKSLAAFGITTVELPAPEPGEYGFACGMNMLHGTLVAEPDGTPASTTEAVDRAQTVHAAPIGTGEEARDDARGVTDRNRETARAVGVGPQVTPQPPTARVEFALPGALRTLPANTAQAEAQLRAIGGVESAEVNFGAERAVLTYDPQVLDPERLREAVDDATGYPVIDRPEPGSEGTEDDEAAARRAEVRDLRGRALLGTVLTLPVLYAAMVAQFIDGPTCPTCWRIPGCSWS
jgi:Cu+-exporting ATPase